MAHDSAMRDWHVSRANEIVRNHPQIKELQGPASITAAAIILLVIVQSMAAVLAAAASWPWLIAAAWFVGAIPALGLFVLLHEGAHGLILGSPRGNRIMMIIATAPLLLPWADGFRHYHLEHHRALGRGSRDVDMPSDWERPLLNSRAGRTIWLLAWPIIQLARLGRCPERPVFTSFMLCNLAFNVGFAGALFALSGVKAVAFCALSVFFAFGFHPLGGRILQEHHAVSADQPSASYYGSANRLLFNAGFHVEHHDFMSIAWLHLPKVRALAVEQYGCLKSHRSWTALVAQFLWRGIDGLRGAPRNPATL